MSNRKGEKVPDFVPPLDLYEPDGMDYDASYYQTQTDSGANSSDVVLLFKELSDSPLASLQEVTAMSDESLCFTAQPRSRKTDETIACRLA